MKEESVEQYKTIPLYQNNEIRKTKATTNHGVEKIGTEREGTKEEARKELQETVVNKWVILKNALRKGRKY